MPGDRIRLLSVAFVVSLGCAPAPAENKPVGAETTPASTNELLPMVPPVHAPEAPWKHRYSSADGVGQGQCSAERLADVVARIRREFPAVAAIDTFRPSGPRGVSMNAGPALPATAPPPPADGTAAFVTAFGDDDAFGVTFFRGERCRGEQCESREYWYFETGDGCQPRWVGHFRSVDRLSSRIGTCVDVDGRALWGFPASPTARSRCDADWSPQNISGTRRAMSADPDRSCGGQSGFIPVEVAISQGADLSKAEFSITGTGIAFLDGRSFAGTVERQGLTANIDEPSTTPCTSRRQIRIVLDFEDSTFTGIPGGFGLIDITETTDGSCPVGMNGCRASLHLLGAE